MSPASFSRPLWLTKERVVVLKRDSSSPKRPPLCSEEDLLMEERMRTTLLTQRPSVAPVSPAPMEREMVASRVHGTGFFGQRLKGQSSSSVSTTTPIETLVNNTRASCFRPKKQQA